MKEMGAKSVTKGQGKTDAAAKSLGLEKLNGFFRDFQEETGRITRRAEDQEPAAEKLQVARIKGSPEELVRKEAGVEPATPKLTIDPKDAKSEIVKMKVSGGELTRKKVEKTESNSGENSNLFSKNHATPDKGAGAVSHAKETRAFTKSSQTDTLKQIVNKAALNFGNGRSEFKIELKPESLGHLKMQILTENQQVTVRILAENPLVKEMIESNLAQLKAGFQNQGLEIEKFDVSVAQDSDKNKTGDGGYGSKRMRAKTGGAKKGYGGKAVEPEKIDDTPKRWQGESAVNFFA